MARADLDTVWLMPGGEDGPLARRFCRSCVPAGPVSEVACVYCGDGPLLADDLAGVDPCARAAVADWLHANGWRVDPALSCPSCRRAFGPGS